MVTSVYVLLEGKVEKTNMLGEVSVEEVGPGGFFGGIFIGWRQAVNIKAL